jgi:hypothetical protein
MLTVDACQPRDSGSESRRKARPHAGSIGKDGSPMCCPVVTIRSAYLGSQEGATMVVRERAIRFGCALAAALFVLVLAGCADVSESGSSPRAQPSKKNPPRQQRDPRCSGAGGPAKCTAKCKPTQPDMLGPFYEPRVRLSGRASEAGMYSPEPFWVPKSASRSPEPGSSSGWPTLAETTTMHTGLRCPSRPERKVPLREQCVRLLRGQAAAHPRSG